MIMTDDPAYQRGDRVRVTLTGEIFEVRPGDPEWNHPEIFLAPDGRGLSHHMTVPLDWPGIVIETVNDHA
jgi:hypothetical protein